MTPEGKVKLAIRTLLKAYGPAIYSVMPSTWGRGASGAPDFLICANGRFIGVEAKVVDNKLTPLQERARDAILNAGGKYLVVYDQITLLDLKDCLDNAMRQSGIRPPT